MFVIAVVCFGSSNLASAAPTPGAIFTTDVACNGTDLNIYGSKAAVYLDGGPAHPGAAGLPDGSYYVQVTAPDGTLLGTSVGSSNETPVHVTNGEFDQCYQLVAILIKASDNTAGGYDTTGNPGGEYKVWISSASDFPGGSTKTDNFKVIENPDCQPGDPDCNPQEEATLIVKKYYDANANGAKDGTEIYLVGWKFRIQDGIDFIRFTPINLVLAPDTYTVTEFMPIQTNWFNTDPGDGTLQKSVILANGDSKTVEFGNLCVGAGGGLTLGFWSNKNGQAIYNSNGSNALLVGLNLRNANGSAFDPANYAAFRTWILSANATNMAYMLSAQLAAMELNVFNGKVNGSSLIYAPGTTSANSLGFATVNDVMAEANAELGAHGLTLSGDANRSYQEALKNALDNANNNKNFVQAEPCNYTFSE